MFKTIRKVDFINYIGYPGNLKFLNNIFLVQGNIVYSGPGQPNRIAHNLVLCSFIPWTSDRYMYILYILPNTEGSSLAGNIIYCQLFTIYTVYTNYTIIMKDCITININYRYAIHRDPQSMPTLKTLDFKDRVFE